MTVKVENLSQLQHKLRGLPDTVHEAAAEEIQATGIKIRDNARRRVPVDTGELRANIKKRSRDRGLDAWVGLAHAGGRGRHFYARFIEFGTRQHVIEPRREEVLYSGARSGLGGRQSSGFGPVSGDVVHPGTPARPFLQPAIEEERRGFPERLARTVSLELKKLAR